MQFAYVAKDGQNKSHKGVTEAASLKEATKLLIDRGWYVSTIKMKGGGHGLFRPAGSGRIPLVDIALFTKHLGTMIKSGISITEALETIEDQTTSKRFKKMVAAILARIKSGRSLSSALAEHPKVFDALMVNMISVGEESGTLEENLNYLATELEDRLDLRQKIKTATLYPSIVFVATFGLGLVLAYFVLPKISKLFETLNFELPLTTRILLGFADVMESYGVYILVGTVVLIITLKIILSQKFARPFWHPVVNHLPLMGTIIRHYNLSLISRTIGTLLKSGLTIDRALLVAAQTTNNYSYQQRLNLALAQVERGRSLAQVLDGLKDSKRHPLFPLLAIKMIGVGERSGQLAESFTYLAEYFEKEVDNSTKNLTTVIEPILLVTIGLIVAFVALSVISPIYQITGQFNQ